jgi:hypothetical protein
MNSITNIFETSVTEYYWLLVEYDYMQRKIPMECINHVDSYCNKLFDELLEDTIINHIRDHYICPPIHFTIPKQKK